MAENQVTLRFESTINKKDSEPILLSGPIQVFAVLDSFEDLSDESLKNAIDTEISGSTREYNKIIVFVKNIGIDTDSIPYRGAYFLLDENLYQEQQELTVNSWQEILLGTHSHFNKDILDSIEKLDVEDDSVLIVTKDNKIEAVSKDSFLSLLGLPELPEDVISAINELKRYDYLTEPEHSEINHLDADRYELTDTYDWAKWKSSAYGSCRDMYLNLIKADKKLYLTDDFKLTTENGTTFINMEIYNVDFNKINFANNICHMDLEIPWNILEQDKPIIFLNDNITDYRNLVSDKHILSFDLYSENEIIGTNEIAVLVICEATTFDIEDIKDAFNTRVLSLVDINNELIKLYIQGEMIRKPDVPHLYLSTDDYGRLTWENKLLSTQQFETDKIIVDNDFLQDKSNFYRGNIRLTFNKKYSKENGDYPLLMANNYFVYDVFPESDDTDNISYLVPMKYLDVELLSDGTYAGDTTFTLVIIKNSTADLISDIIGKKYITKEDAVGILSHGKIDLSDYAKKEDLVEYSKVNHTHNNYSIISHNHDYRYANFKHTHPEIIKYILEILGDNVSEEEIESKLEELSDTSYERFISLLESLLELSGFEIAKDANGSYKYSSIKDSSIFLSTESVVAINQFLDEYGLELPENPTIQDFERVVIALFRIDYVTDNQVILKKDIPVKLINGPIGGIDSERTYKKGSDLSKILEDILNPYMTVSEISEYVIPTNFEVKLYNLSLDGEIMEINPEKINFNLTSGTLLLKPILLNKFGKEASYKIIKNNEEFIIKPTAASQYQSYGDYLIYEENFQYGEKEIEISIGYDSFNIYDSYGFNETIIEGAILDTKTIGLSIEYPKFIFGAVNNLENIDLSDFIHGSTTKSFKIYDISENPILVLGLSDDWKHSIIENVSKANVGVYFDKIDETISFYGKTYELEVYRVISKKINSIDLTVII